MRNLFLYAALILTALPLHATENPLELPPDWQKNISTTPATMATAPNAPLQLLTFYRRVIGSFDGERGNGYTVNSLYAHQALTQFGPVLGTWLTVDRLLRDWREIAHPALLIRVDNRVRYADPLSRNTFWIKKEQDSSDE